MSIIITKITQKTDNEPCYHLGDGSTSSKADLQNRVSRGDEIKILFNGKLTKITDVSLLDSKTI